GGDTELGELECHRAGEAHHSRFGGTVWRQVDGTHQTGDRGDGDDSPVAALRHVARGGLRAVERAEEMRAKMVLPVLRRDLEKRLRLGDPRIVHQHVDLAERTEGIRHELLYGGVIADVAHAGERAPAE